MNNNEEPNDFVKPLTKEQLASQECSCGCGQIALLTHNTIPGYFADMDCIRKIMPNAKWTDTWVINEL